MDRKLLSVILCYTSHTFLHPRMMIKQVYLPPPGPTGPSVKQWTGTSSFVTGAIAPIEIIASVWTYLLGPSFQSGSLISQVPTPLTNILNWLKHQKDGLRGREELNGLVQWKQTSFHICPVSFRGGGHWSWSTHAKICKFSDSNSNILSMLTDSQQPLIIYNFISLHFQDASFNEYIEQH